MIYDGNGGEPFKGDIGINGDTIAFIGDLSNADCRKIDRCEWNGSCTRFYQYAELGK